MPKFKIVASKSNKKYSLILTANTESEARERIHNEGYSILSVQIAEDTDIQGKKFIFEVLTSTGVKKGVIVGNDILKAYIKLVDELAYNVLCLYPEEDEGKLTAEEKQKIITDLARWLELLKSKQKHTENTPKKEEGSAKDTSQIDESFYLKKELEETHKLIDKVIEKLTPIINKEKQYNISEEKFEKLNTLYGSIITLKKSTNISKLREIGELALIKIGAIELETLESKKSAEAKKYLWETNTLLKKIGSKKQFIEKNKDIGYLLSLFIESFSEKFQELRSVKNALKEKKEKMLIDKDSYSFLKTVLLLEKYTERLKQNNKELLQNIGSILIPTAKNKEISEKIFTKRRVIIQNISLLKAKKSWKVKSYTLAVKGYHKFIELFFAFIAELTHFFYYIIYIYSFFFVVYFVSIRLWVEIPWIHLNYRGLYLFLGILVITLLWSLSKNIIFFTFNVVFFLFLLIFSLVNF